MKFHEIKVARKEVEDFVELYKDYFENREIAIESLLNSLRNLEEIARENYNYLVEYGFLIRFLRYKYQEAPLFRDYAKIIENAGYMVKYLMEEKDIDLNENIIKIKLREKEKEKKKNV